MKFTVVLLTVISLIFLLGCGKAEKTEKIASKKTEQSTTMHQEGQIVYYTCPMEEHAKVHSDEPGKCELCGMDLVAVKITDKEHADFYGCPMEEHSYVRSEKPGVCPECGMKLQPMKIEKGM